MNSLKVLSYNIKKGHHKENSFDLIAKLLEKSDCDVLLIQEAQKKTQSSSIVERLADSNWPHYKFQRNSVIGSTENGNMIVSKFPIVEHWNLKLSYSRFLSRSVLWAKIHLPMVDQHIMFGSAHVGFLPGENHFQCKKIWETLSDFSKNSQSFILGGDFNSWGVDSFRSSPWKTSPRRRTFPSTKPYLALDKFVYSDNFRLEEFCLQGDITPQPSDHLALLGDFRQVE